MNLPRFSVQRPVFTTMITLIVLTIGAVSLSRLRIDLLDDCSFAVEVHVIADPSARLQDLGKVLQSEIARALEHMPGTPVEAVNVFIDEVEFDGSELKS